MSRKVNFANLLLVASFVLVTPMLAQGTQSGTIRGTVTDEDGGALPGAVVTAASDSLQGVRETVTSGNGSYVLRGLPRGDYTVTVTMDGMSTVETTQTLELGQSAEVSAQLPANFEDLIVVTGESVSALETPTVGINLSAEEVDTLPTGNRSMAAIADLSPGLTQGSTSQVAGQVSISGGFQFDSVFLLDGVDITDPIFATATSLFIEDAIEETQVLTSGISAEYGRFSGGVVNAITKSGGNEFSGSLRLDTTNPLWREETPLEDTNGVERANDRSDIYSGTLGGKIIEDQLWFFAAGRDTSRTTQILLARTGIPFSQPDDDERLEGKLTATVAEKHNLSAGFMERDRAVVRPSLGSGSTLQTIESIEFPQELTKFNYNGVWTPSVFADAQYSEKQFGFRHIPQSSVGTDISDSPIRCWNQAGCSYNAVYFDATDPEDRDNEQTAASVSYFGDTNHGTHDLRFGVEEFTNINVGGNSQTATDWVLFIDPLLDASGNVVIGADGDLIPNPQPSSLGVFFEAVRGAELQLQTQSFYVNDRWQLDDHWSFNLGLRYEDISSGTNAGAEPVSTDAIVPRLAATYDVKGDGRYRVTGTYGEYAGGYGFGGNNYAAVTNVGTPSYVYGYYYGTPGDPNGGFDPNAWGFFAGAFPTANVFFNENVSSPTVQEFTLQGGIELPKGGYFEATFVDRSTDNFVEDLFLAVNGSTTVNRPDLGIRPITLNNVVYDNTDSPTREYQAGILQGRYNITEKLSIEGHWTHQFKNDGDYEGETGQSFGASTFGDFPEALDRRNAPLGRLDEFTEDKIRLWARYNFNFGRGGSLSTSLLGNYESGGVFDFSTRFPLTSIQRGLISAAGYANPPATPTLFFGDRGAGDFASWTTFDLALNYSIPTVKALDFYVKAEVFNILNEDKQIFWDTTISANRAGPLDSLGRPTTFTQAASFGNARNNADYVTPREYRFAVGFRF